MKLIVEFTEPEEIQRFLRWSKNEQSEREHEAKWAASEFAEKTDWPRDVIDLLSKMRVYSIEDALGLEAAARHHPGVGPATVKRVFAFLEEQMKAKRHAKIASQLGHHP